MSRLSAQRRLRSFAIMFAIEGDGEGGVCVGAQDARVGHISGRIPRGRESRILFFVVLSIFVQLLLFVQLSKIVAPSYKS